MKRIALALMLVFALGVSLSCQTVDYASPQTVTYDPPEGVEVGYFTLVSYDAEVIEYTADKGIEGNYVPIALGITLDEVFVSLEASGLQGVYVVVISANLIRVSDGVAIDGERGYSDNINDVDGEMFRVVLEPGMKVRRIRIR